MKLYTGVSSIPNKKVLASQPLLDFIVHINSIHFRHQNIFKNDHRLKIKEKEKFSIESTLNNARQRQNILHLRFSSYFFDISPSRVSSHIYYKKERMKQKNTFTS